MSIRSRLGGGVVLAFALTASGAAFARQPPALAQRQEAASRVISTCEQGASSTPGYRDMLARLEKASPTGAVASTRAPVIVRRMGDHVVLLCPGGRVHGPGGYRDLDRRFSVEQREMQVAKARVPGATCAVR